MAQDKYGYIPPSVQRQMDQHMQHMPANLQKYQGGNTYIPQKAAKEMASYMQKSMPAHMKEYITPYMQQQTQAGLNSLDPVTNRTPQQRAPSPDLMRRDHSAFSEQFNVNIDTSSKSGSLSHSPQFSAQQNAPSPAPPPVNLPTNNQTPYDFIMQNSQKNSGKFGFNGSKKSRIIVIAIIGLVLMMLFIIIATVITSSGKSGTQSLVSLAREQNEIIRISDLGITKARTSDAKNLATITSYSFRTVQTDTLAVLAKQGHKLKPKDLAFIQKDDIDKQKNIDSQLSSADLNNKFDETFTKQLGDSLITYQRDVKQIYDSTTNKTERQVLLKSYNGVTLLVGGQTAQTN